MTQVSVLVFMGCRTGGLIHGLRFLYTAAFVNGRWIATMRLLPFLLLSLVLLGACGQRGPLYLPDAADAPASQGAR